VLGIRKGECFGGAVGREDLESDPDDMGGQKILEVKTVTEVIYRPGL
jgi:hypothetical protein